MSFFITGTGLVVREWIDQNQHVNISRYTEIVDRSLQNLSELPGSIYGLLSKDVTYVASRSTMHYLKELIIDMPWSVSGAFISFNSTYFETVHIVTSEDKRIGRFFVKCSYFSLVTRNAVRLSENQMGQFTIPILREIVSPF